MNDKPLLFIINTPSQAHTWHYIIDALTSRGHEIVILARDYGGTPQLLDSFGFKYRPFRPQGSQFGRLVGVMKHFENCYSLARGSDLSTIVGFGLDAAVTATRRRIPCITFFDDEHTVVQNRLTSWFADWVITPDTFKNSLGRKHIRVKGYKELAYLHPSHYVPDPSVYDELKLEKNEPFMILRLNLMDAIHDIGYRDPLSVTNGIELVRSFEKYLRVFVSPEGTLPVELEGNRLPIRYDRIHHALFYANLLLSNSCTMTTEAAILGTPAVRIHPIVGRGVDPAVYVELEQEYDLVYSFRDLTGGVRKAFELISNPQIKEEWAQKRQRLLADKIDVSKFMLDFIEKGPDSCPVNSACFG